MPNLPKLPDLCIPASHVRKNHQKQHQRKSTLDIDDHVLDKTDLTRKSSGSSQGPTNNFFGKWPDGLRGHVVAMIAEFVGTVAFLFFGFAAAQTANNKADNLSDQTNNNNNSESPSLLQIMYISFVFGFSLAVNVWVFYRVSGGMFNPAVSLGLWMAGAFNWIRLICVIPVQFGGGIVAAALVSGIFPGDLEAASSLAEPTTSVQGLFIELMLTAELVMTIIMLAVVKSRTSFMAPFAIGLALFIGHLIGINYTGASMNPARTLGPAIVGNSFDGSTWIYFAGPFAGAVIAAGLYHLLKAMAFWTANPEQDDDGLDYVRVVPSPQTSPRTSDGDMEKRPLNRSSSELDMRHNQHTVRPYASSLYPSQNHAV